ncbi:hypothetical protein GOBAR_AA04531 [Gossypium barbadense]|uniref:Uncharacterized protein n=1 Tax=Gossypium barbadense TaxID=3634 RepID=A0A2P5YKB3_GOSBA|nr:hypothetical protein GOBAR_AA04531 [Gossypium barbadense]
MDRCIDWATLEQVHLADSVRALLATTPWDRFFDIVEPMYLELTLELCSTFQMQTVMAEHDDPGTIQFRLGSLVRQLSVPEFGVALGLYTKEFIEADNFPHLHRHIHYAPSSCWSAMMPGIQSMLYMRMIECHRGFDPLQYRLARSINKDDAEDISDDIPTFQEDPPSQPPLRHQPVHAATSLSKVSDHLHRFKQYCTQRFGSIEATLQQIYQHFHISPPTPPPQDLAVDKDF